MSIYTTNLSEDEKKDLEDKRTQPTSTFEDYVRFDSPETLRPPIESPPTESSNYNHGQSQKNAPEEEPDITEHIGAVVGEKLYYVDQFVTFFKTGTGIKPWNWAAFLVGPAWFLYRQVYSLFFISLITYSASYWAEQVNASESIQLTTTLSFLIAWIYCTIQSNKTYYAKAIKRINEVKACIPSVKKNN